MSEMTDELKYDFGCASCGYKNTEGDGPIGRIDERRVIEKLDALFARNDMAGAGRLLSYWRSEAFSLRDKQGELTVVSEQIGYFRKTGEKEKGLSAVARALALIGELGAPQTVPIATVYLNAATTMKAFDKADESMPLYEKAREIYLSSLPANHPLLGGFYNNYALALADTGRKEEAEEAYRKAIAIMTEKKGGKPDAAVSYINLAHMLEDLRPDEIPALLDTAAELLEDGEAERDGYYAYVLSKCAPSFAYFGREKEAAAMTALSEELYARA